MTATTATDERMALMATTERVSPVLGDLVHIASREPHADWTYLAVESPPPPPEDLDVAE